MKIAIVDNEKEKQDLREEMDYEQSLGLNRVLEGRDDTFLLGG